MSIKKENIFVIIRFLLEILKHTELIDRFFLAYDALLSRQYLTI